MPVTPRARGARASSRLGENYHRMVVIIAVFFLTQAYLAAGKVQRLCALSAALTTRILYTTAHRGTTRAIFSPGQIGCTKETATVRCDGLLTCAECQSREEVFMNPYLHQGRFSTPADLCYQLSAADRARSCG